MTKRRKIWMPEDDELLRKLKNQGVHVSEIALRMGCTVAGLDARWHMIRNRDDPAETPAPTNEDNSRAPG